MGLHKGQTNNPNGQPHVWETFKAIIQRYSIKTIDDLKALNPDELPYKEGLTIKKMIKAWEDDNEAERVINRVDGTPTAFVENTVKTDNENSLSKAIHKFINGE